MSIASVLATVAARLRRDDRGVVLIEFALIFPILLTMLLGMFDVTNLLIMQRRVSLAAAQIAEIATTLAIQPNTTNVLDYDEVYNAATVIFAYFPGWQTNNQQTFSVAVSAFVSGPPPNCQGNGCNSTVASVAWSVAGSQNQPYASWSGFNFDAAQERPCQPPLTAAPPSQTPNRPGSNTPASSMGNYTQIYTVPAGVLSVPSVIVADVSAVFTPLFLKFITGPVLITRSYFLPPRAGNSSQYVPYVSNSSTSPSQMNSSNAQPVELCSGYQ